MWEILSEIYIVIILRWAVTTAQYLLLKKYKGHDPAGVLYTAGYCGTFYYSDKESIVSWGKNLQRRAKFREGSLQPYLRSKNRSDLFINNDSLFCCFIFSWTEFYDIHMFWNKQDLTVWFMINSV